MLFMGFRVPTIRQLWAIVIFCKLASGVWGRAPETEAILKIFLAKWSTFWALVSLIFCNNEIEKSRPMPMPKPSRKLYGKTCQHIIF